MEYKNNRDEFLIQVMNNPSYIEGTSGINKLIEDIKLDDIDLDEF
jgi:hypothetical protein